MRTGNLVNHNHQERNEKLMMVTATGIDTKQAVRKRTRRTHNRSIKTTVRNPVVQQPDPIEERLLHHLHSNKLKHLHLHLMIPIQHHKIQIKSNQIKSKSFFLEQHTQGLTKNKISKCTTKNIHMNNYAHFF